MSAATFGFHRTARFVALLVFAVSTAHAEVRCVSDVSTLISAFDDANNGPEGSSWDIRLQSGTYQLSGDLDFIPDGNHDNKAFYLSGGWDASCSSQTENAALTLIRGIASTPSAQGTSFNFVGDNSRYDIEWLRFENFSQFRIDDKHCQPFYICPGTDAIILYHDEFNNGELVTISVYDAKRVVFANNLVTNMAPIFYPYVSYAGAPVGIGIFTNQDPPEVMFNTFANLTCNLTAGGVMINTQQPTLALHHNIFQTSNCNDGVFIDPSDSGQAVLPWRNLFLTIGGDYAAYTATQGNVLGVVDPKFVDPAAGNFRLQNTSPAVNAGMTLLEAVQQGFYSPTSDLDGQPRPIGTRYDLGAYESPVNDGAPPVITVTDTSDDVNDSGSLRHAIAQANSQVGTAQRIAFNIPGGCPQFIFLDAPLPDITDPLFIDGYSQPGSVPNDLDLGSDATVCVILAPFGSNVSHALQVPGGEPDTTQLVVDGLGFGSGLATFVDAAVELRAGSDHIIKGSVFGGVMPSSGNSIGVLPRAVLIRGTANHATIGGPEPSARNYIGNNSYNAIVITDNTTSGHSIQNNYIGVTPNGLSAQANSADGISATGGSNVSIIGNTIDASGNGIYLSGSSTQHFTVQNNNIGVNAAGYGVTQHANNVGILVAGGSNQHTIGAAPTENLQTGAYSNLIDNNKTAGVWITPTAGGYISIRGNLIEANGQSGTGLGIDLGALGQLPNDAGDGDSGPNLSQNYPVIKSSTPNGATRAVSAALNTNPNATLRIDFYRSPTCPAGPVGANATTYVGSVDVSSSVTGVVNVTAQIAPAGAPGYLTATATTNVGHTSELAPCFSEDTIFVDGFEMPGL